MVAAVKSKVFTDREFPFTERDFDTLRSMVRSRTGIVLGEQKVDMVYGRLVKRLRALKLTSFSDYCGLLEGEQGETEIENLINAVTTNLTKFFREPHHFEHLRQHVLPDAMAGLKAAGTPPLRIWSAGCSTGEEPYSIAMTVAAVVGNPDPNRIKILATDLDSNVLRTGATGLYSTDSFSETPPALWKNFSHRHGDGGAQVRMSDKLRNLIAFKRLNLLQQWPLRQLYDAIFCRNVLIYFDNETKAQLIDRFAERLLPGGTLYLGHSESILTPVDNLRPIGQTAYRKTQ